MQFGDVGITVIEELCHQPQQMFLLIKDVVEVEEFQQQQSIVFLFQQGQLADALLGFFFLMADIVLHPLV